MTEYVNKMGKNAWDFTHLHAFFLFCSIVTYLADVTLGESTNHLLNELFINTTLSVSADVILAATYFSDGYYWYCIITVCLVAGPTLVVQLFSARWHHMDECMDSGMWILHFLGLGVVHR